MGMNEVWRDSSVFRMHKEPARAEFTLHDSREAALKPLDLSNPWNSSCYLSLNGKWDFNWYGHPDAVPADWHEASGSVKAWNSIPVPGTWQGAGFDRLYYLNVTMPFEYDWDNNAERRPEFSKENIESARRFGFIPDDAQTVGCYRRWVDLSAGQLQGRVVLRIGSAEAGLKVFVNGREAGYSQGSFLPAEFDLSTYVKPGKNLIALKLFRWTDGSYMEVQDMIRFAGIYRDVFLRFEPRAHIRDIYFMGVPDRSLHAVDSNYRVKVANQGKGLLKGCKIQFSLYSAGENTPVKKWDAKVDAVEPGMEAEVSGNLKLMGLKLWSTDQPNLYTLVAELIDAAGKVTQTARIDTGFRRFESIDGNLHLNGKRFFVRGVNRHDHHPRLGKVVPVETMIRDAELMKQNNINTVRTSHYPNDERWYYICNRYGIALIDEANVECHLFRDIPGDRIEWAAAAVDRMERLAERDKNHPSVFMWSLGNESSRGWVLAFDGMYNIAKKIDPSRMVMCDRGCYPHSSGTRLDRPDTVTPMYRALSRIKERLKVRAEKEDKRPFFMCEYRHAMGNAVGALQDVWDLVYANENSGINGGCIWDWTDQGVEARSADGEVYYQYGGDWDDAEHRGNFSCNGLILSDQGWTPKLAEVKKVYEPIKMRATDLEKGEVEIHNRFIQTDLEALEFDWVLRENGVVIEQGKLPVLSANPDAKARVAVPLDRSTFSADKEYFLRMSCKTREDSRWAAKGHEVTFFEFALGGKYTEKSAEVKDVPEVASAEDRVTVSTKNGVAVTFDRKRGKPVSIKVGGKELLAASERDQLFDYSIAWIDNYKRKMTDVTLSDYRKLELDKLARKEDAEFSVSEEGGIVTVSVTSHFMSPEDAGVDEVQTWSIDGAGRMDVSISVAPTGELTPDVWIPRVGVRIPLVPELNQMSYYGLGPHGNYVDRLDGAWMGIHSSRVMDQYVPYIRPQDHGNREAVRWLEVKDQSGTGLKVLAPESLAMSVLPYTQDELLKAWHTIDLPRKPTATELRISPKVSGVGNGSCGSATDEQYRATAAAVDYRFVLVPVMP